MKLPKWRQCFAETSPLTVMSILLLFSLCTQGCTTKDSHESPEALRLGIRIVPANKNSFKNFKDLDANLYYPSNKKEQIEQMVYEQKWDIDLARTLVSNNQSLFQALPKLLTTMDFQDPLFSNSAPITLKSFPDNEPDIWERISNLIYIYSWGLAAKGKVTRAYDAAALNLSLGSLLQKSQIGFRQFTVASRVKQKGWRALRGFSSQMKQDQSIQDLLTALEKTRDSRLKEVDFKRQIQIIYLYQKLLYNSISRDSWFGRVSMFIQGDPFSQKFFLEQIEKTPAPCMLQSEFTKEFKWEDDPSLTEAFSWTYSTTPRIFFEKTCREVLSQRATELVLALNCHRIQQNHFPATLEEIDPSCTTDLPNDPFSNQPFLYDSRERRIWSKGKKYSYRF